MKKYLGLAYKTFARIFKIESRYISQVRNSNEWVYISYIPEVFYNLWNKKYMSGHQSRQEMVEMVRIFNEMGYNVYVSNFVNYTLPSLDIKLVFGVEPGFTYACQKYPNAQKIYYATGAYHGHQNEMIKRRTDVFNSIHRANYPYQRLVKAYGHLDCANRILQIGSKYTVDTYPEKYRILISTIHQSSTIRHNKEYTINYATENEFMWIGGGGSILKGLDIVLDYFIDNPQKIVHIVGTIDCEFMDIYRDKIGDNIKLHGFMDLNSREFMKIVSRCNFLIYPSCTEGGCPGAVINAMLYGLIPIVTPWAAFDEINEYGFLMKEITKEEISSVVAYMSKNTENSIYILKKKCNEYATDNFNLKMFSKEFQLFFKNVNL